MRIPRDADVGQVNHVYRAPATRMAAARLARKSAGMRAGLAAKLVVASQQGKQAVVAILGAGEFFGEGCLIGQPLRLATARTIADSDVMRVKKLRWFASYTVSRFLPRCSWPIS